MDVLFLEKIYIALNYAVQGVYFFIPAYIANMAPTFLFFLKNKTPISQRWLGSNKTWSGFSAGMFMAVPAVWLQKDLSHVTFFESISIIDYSKQSVVVLGLLYGAGAMVGDALKSLLKRRVGIPSGSKWRPWDQLDFICGATLFLLPVVWVGWWQLGAALCVTLFLHPAVNILGYRLGFKAVPW